MFLHRLGKIRAPEFPKNLQWMNSEAMTMKSLAGKVVLIDFWTYSCVNCIRTIPHLNALHNKYKDIDLVVIGVHTPEFAFEKDAGNVERAVKNLGVKYAVVLDPDYKIWNAYANRWWPRTFLIDKKGTIVYDRIGEGGYVETEVAVQRALEELGHKNLPEIEPSGLVGGGICYRTTPETYLGFLRGRYGNALDLVPNKEHIFTDEGTHEDDLIYLHGHWRVLGEKIEHARKLASPTDYLALKYNAFSVNLVASSLYNNKSRFIIELDGRPLVADMAGRDVKIEDGISFVEVKDARMYNIVDSDTYHKGVLKIRTQSDNIAFFAFTFGGCER